MRSGDKIFLKKEQLEEKKQKEINPESNYHTPATEFGVDQVCLFTRQSLEAAAATFQCANE